MDLFIALLILTGLVTVFGNVSAGVILLLVALALEHSGAL